MKFSNLQIHRIRQKRPEFIDVDPSATESPFRCRSSQVVVLGRIEARHSPRLRGEFVRGPVRLTFEGIRHSSILAESGQILIPQCVEVQETEDPFFEGDT